MTTRLVYSKQIHSFISNISIAPLQVHYNSEALQTTALILSINNQNLEVQVDQFLTWSDHITNIASKIGRILFRVTYLQSINQ